jgi:pimeloyl-ACP methyl ester carboxylesterase
MTVEFIELDWCGRRVSIEHEWIGTDRAGRPLLVFLHEGLGSRSMWRDFPQRLCDAGGFRGLVYSRPGYGRSTPRAHDERWGVDFMHRQAHELLPALLQALHIAEAPWLLGHSDGGSIALLHAARHPEAVAGLVVMAPHLFVEDISVASIQRTREIFDSTDLRQRLARHHDDVDSAFWGWNHIWLDPAFRAWNIEAEVAHIRCPLLAIQGVDDEYGTLEQIHRIQRRLPGTQLLELAQCAHSPHRDQPERVIDATVDFIGR